MCLIETCGRRCIWFVAFRGPGGVTPEVPADGWCRLVSDRRAPHQVLAVQWLERGTCTAIWIRSALAVP